ncbi:DUF7448 domain-containing protein [Mycobacteroides abscessus]|jgi:hypothetical protein|uniref:DUF7448 domain-containing protein n=1 Tax=Mycobacteroides abscessus TaxID=36809 RepID=UPI00034B0935|nr:hypothetical protein [Mycobacteroides abscessus]MDM1884337.1 hypothetical protein [Mycobacteroides abscessus]MDM1890197.1 hypothetical protein [Mycobacteroides abscessus]RIR40925.1 hypothetical protein D2E38_01460 [Mycobacteroides abscessus]RIR42494.1 hypothetical protein D2E36_09725 [Mycobacteroides abscessus]RIS41994.1 hypothetical protein D2E71_17505 [Mycobacteroides abscessus]
MAELVKSPYPPDSVDYHPGGYSPDDDGTMSENVAELAKCVVGHRIVKAENGQTVNLGPYDGKRNCYSESLTGLVLTLDSGVQVVIADTSDCCASTTLEKFLLHPERVDHVITGVASTDGFTKWHIFADFGDVMELEVSWSAGNPFYYGYGFDIAVGPLEGEIVSETVALPSARRELEAGR